jgi:hypothetical protein
MHNSFILQYMYYLNTSTCFEQYYAHLQEVKIVFSQHLVSSLGRAVHRLRAHCTAAHRVMIPDAVKIQFLPPEDEHSIVRNMSRYLM